MATYLDDEPIEIPGVGRRRRQVAVAALVLLTGAGVLGARVANSHGATFRPAATASAQTESLTTRRLREIPPPPDLPQETAELAGTASHGAGAGGQGPVPSPASHGAPAAQAPAFATNAPRAADKPQATVFARPAAPPSPAIRAVTPPVASPAPKARIVHDTPF